MKNVLWVLLFLNMLCSCAVGIHRAVKYQDLEKVKIYVADGKVNQRESSLDQTPLLSAAYYGYADVVEYLCDNGADLDAQAADGSTALIYSARYRFEDVTRVLLQHGASVNLTDKQGHSALYYAKFNRYYRIAKLLEANGASFQ